MDIERVKQIGIRAAYRGGEILKRHFGHLTTINKKGIIDLVTAADIESEQVIVDTIRSVFPSHCILAEESGLQEGDPETQWIIDPLDGTTNFAHSLSIFSVSIAFLYRSNLIFGVVLNPCSGEMFTAAVNQGAYLNNQAIEVSKTEIVRDSLLATGFPYELPKMIPGVVNRFVSCLGASQGIRRLGSAALDLCYVACGRFDGFWEENLKPWDTAAGVLIAQEAGAKVTDFADQPFEIQKKQILATNGHIQAEMIALLNIEETK